MYNKEEWGGHGEHDEHCCGGHMFWSKENKIALLEKKEKMLEAKLEFIRKIKENMKKEMSKEQKAWLQFKQNRPIRTIFV